MAGGAEGGSDESVNRKLTMPEVYALSYVAAQARGFPDAAPDGVAGRVLWLERRGLQGVLGMMQEFLLHKDTPILQRGNQCPFIAGTLLLDQFDKLVSPDPMRPTVIAGPTNGLLLLPKVAEYAARIGRTIMVSWYSGEPRQSIGQSLVDAENTVFRGDINAALQSTATGFALFPGSMPVAASPLVEEMEMPTRAYELLAWFVGPDKMLAAKAVAKAIENEDKIIGLLRLATDGDRSVLLASHRMKADDQIILTTSAGSNNEDLWHRFVDYGWTRPHTSDQPEALKGLLSQYVATEEGRLALPLLALAVNRFPLLKH
jgi:hypothetical protein